MGSELPGFVGYAIDPAAEEEPISGRLIVDLVRFAFQSEQVLLEAPLGQLEIEKGEGKDGRIFFSCPEHPGWVFYTFDERILSSPALLRLTPLRQQIESIRNRGELKRRLIITGSCLGAVVVIIILISSLSGMAVRALVARISPEFEQQVGEEILEDVKTAETFSEDPKKIAELGRMMAPLLKVVPSNGITFKSYIVNDPLPNAFAVPGGHIFVTTGLLDLAERPEEVTATVAHELAHVTQKHIFRQAISSAGPFVLFRVFLGSRGLSGLIGQGSELLVTQSFSQKDELEADAIGWDYLVAAHIDPRNLAAILKKLQAADPVPEASQIRAFSSHPATEKRLRRLDAKWAKLKVKTGFIDLSKPAAD